MKIKRARGYRLYTTDSKRILDLSMDFGRAVIGHRPNGLSLTLKNCIERGIYSRYSNIFNNRLVKELNKRFPKFPHVTILEHPGKLSYFSENIVDPLFSNESGSTMYWRPFLDTPDCDNLVILYPLPGLNTTQVVVSKKKQDISSDLVSPILLSGILRSLNDYTLEYDSISNYDFSKFSKIENTTLTGPYLIFNYSDNEYKKLVDKAGEKGILLNNREKFAVLNIELSKGEVSNILSLFK